jgi:F-type H+-transporting ATPase subunit a
MMRRLLVSLLLLVMTPAIGAVASESETGAPDAVAHAADGYYLDFDPLGKPELPRIFLVRRESGALGFDAFWSTHAALHSGNYTLLSEDGHPLSEEEIHEAEALHEHVYFPLVPKEGHVIIDFSVTRQLVFVFVAAFILLFIALRLAARYKKGIGAETAPQGIWQNLMETIILFVRDEICRPALGDKTNKYLPYLLTAFFYILIGNLLGLVPWGVSPTAGIAVTGALATFTFFITQIAGTRDYWMHIFWPPGVPVFTKFILVPIEIVGMFIKPMALAFRLFGNMVSGHLVIVSLLGMIFIFTTLFGSSAGVVSIFVSVPLTVFIYMLKLAVALIQAYVFTILSAVFIGLAVEEHEHGDHEPHAAKPAADQDNTVGEALAPQPT